MGHESGQARDRTGHGPPGPTASTAYALNYHTHLYVWTKMYSSSKRDT